MATDHEIGHGRDISWTLRAKQAPEHIAEAWIGTSWIGELKAIGLRDGKTFQATHLFLPSLRTTPESLLRLVLRAEALRACTGSVTPSSRKMPIGIGAMTLGRWPLCAQQD